jgi:PadR family transcriptional regulator, regulatory protein PadR
LGRSINMCYNVEYILEHLGTASFVFGNQVMKEPKINFLGQFEELVLIATLGLRDDAYGVKIRQRVESATGKSVSVGALYTTLDRLERKGYVKSWLADPTAERGGRAKRYFQVQATGRKALSDTDRARHRLTCLAGRVTLKGTT